MKAMESKIVLLCLVVMGYMPSIGHADTLQKAIDESLIVSLTALEAHAEAEAQAILAPFDPIWHDKIKSGLEYQIALAKAKAFAKAKARAKAKAQQGKQRARHCRATLKPVDDHLEIIEIINCVQTMEAIADSCTIATNQIRLGNKLIPSIATVMDRLREYVTQCVTKNITGFSALMVYEVKRETKDQYAGLIEKCRQEETNTLGVLGYEFIWPCFKGYLDMIDEPLEPDPTEISPKPTEDSKPLPKVKA